MAVDANPGAAARAVVAQLLARRTHILRVGACPALAEDTPFTQIDVTFTPEQRAIYDQAFAAADENVSWTASVKLGVGLGGDVLGLHAQRLAQGLVAAQLLVAGQRIRCRRSAASSGITPLGPLTTSIQLPDTYTGVKNGRPWR